jgi:hypothetical protein
VPSKSDPKKPHIVNIHPNWKCECDNCHAYKSSFICAHVIAACVKKSRLMDFLRWLVTVHPSAKQTVSIIVRLFRLV